MENQFESGTNISSENEHQNGEQGCLPIGLFVLYLLWIGAISLAALIGMWLLENLLFEGSLGLPDGRGWVAAAYLFLVGFPLIILVWLKGKFQSFYRALGVVVGTGLLMLPARWLFLTDFQAAALIVAAALGVGIWITSKQLSRYSEQQHLTKEQGLFRFSILWLVAGLSCIPYALWGAFGSPVDVVLGMAIGGLLGWFLALLLDWFVISYRSIHASQQTPSLFLRGLWMVSAGLVLANSIPLVGYQFSLTTPLIFSAPAIVAISRVLENASPDMRRRAVAFFGGSAAILPLIFIDGDELMLVITSSAGELMGYALRMAFWHGLILLISGTAGLILIGRVRRLVISRWMLIPAGLVWAGGLAIYFILGQPGFYGEQLFVIFRQQVDFADQPLPDDPLERRNLVYQTLVNHAERTQADIRGQLERFGIGYRSYYLVNAMEVNGGPLIRVWLMSHPGVDRVLPSPRLRPLAQPLPAARGSYEDLQPNHDWNLKMVRAPQVWSEFNVRGKGIVIGLADSGADWEHPQLKEQYRGKDGLHNYNWLDVWYGSSAPTDTSGHGTHTLGSIVGKDVGIAPEAQWIGCVNLARNLGNPAVYLECWQFLFAPYPQGGDALRDGRPDLGAHIFNNSWGCPEVEGCDPAVFLPAVRALKAAGVFVVVSAGNSGFAGCGSVDAPPAIYEEVLTVGAVNRNGDLAGFSSLGPVVVDGSQRLKAEILAPGEEIFSSYPNSTYEMVSGTSMAGPHVAGVVALMWSANPALIGEVDKTRQIIFETAQTYQGILPSCVGTFARPAQGIGYGIVDAYLAVKQARDVR